jgi:hypothetical protein
MEEEKESESRMGEILASILKATKGILQVFGKALLASFKIPFVRYFVAFVLILLIVVFTIRTKPELIGLSRESGEEQVEETQQLVEEVGKIIELPEEVPTIATVTEIEKVREQKFFAKAENGDKVLIFTGAKKAILYRPSEKKIIEVGVVNVNEEIQTQQEVRESTGSAEIITPTKAPTFTPTITPTIFVPTATVTPSPSGSE